MKPQIQKKHRFVIVIYQLQEISTLNATTTNERLLCLYFAIIIISIFESILPVTLAFQYFRVRE